MGKGVLEPSYRRRVGYQAALLGGMAMFATALLVLGDNHTNGDIAAREAEDLQRSLAEVIPAGLHDNNLLQDTVRIDDKHGQPHLVYRATRDGQFTAAAFEMIGHGYSGDIRLIMGLDKKGKILGVRVLNHSETPGLGDKIEVEKTSWILGFNGHSLKNTSAKMWHVKKDGGEFDQFTGATITPRAVVRAVHRGLTFYQAAEDAIAADSKTNPGGN